MINDQSFSFFDNTSQQPYNRNEGSETNAIKLKTEFYITYITYSVRNFREWKKIIKINSHNFQGQ